MTFWQENYGFVKDVYDFRLQKYQEWMDNLEAIVSKVMAPNVQYTYKEFKNIKDSLTVSIYAALVGCGRSFVIQPLDPQILPNIPLFVPFVISPSPLHDLCRLSLLSLRHRIFIYVKSFTASSCLYLSSVIFSSLRV